MADIVHVPGELRASQLTPANSFGKASCLSVPNPSSSRIAQVWLLDVRLRGTAIVLALKDQCIAYWAHLASASQQRDRDGPERSFTRVWSQAGWKIVSMSGVVGNADERTKSGPKPN